MSGLMSLVLDHLDWLPALIPGAGAIWAGIKGAWRWAAVCVSVIAAAVVWVWIAGLRHDLAVAEIHAAEARRREAATATVLARVQDQARAARAALQSVEIARQEAESDAQSLRRRITAAPRSRACADSPAIRGLLDDLRAGADDDHP
ncbi:hypothetical protein L2U69_11745 [Zavarzinia compransoris]|uniref:hypothetical protein n=1 Tax=Zavarzinia marina TaxID=2911065 RepID=UPI001F2D637D|nr:hypothetical protein [Zavarzinia marina]MCF4166319.1 hypothetical protein [Zavarzinia marina]